LAAGLAARLDSVMMVDPSRERPESWESRFEKLYLDHYGRVLGVLFRLTSSRSEAEELSNEVFWKLYRQRLRATSWEETRCKRKLDSIPTAW